MRIGVVTDVHDAADQLARALAVIRAERVDAIVCLGDTTDQFGPHNHAAEVAMLLRDAGAKLVWGNHDHGLCYDPSPVVRAKYDADTLATFASASPHVELAGCHFSHVEPWIDANDPAALWHFDGLPRTAEMRGKTFAAFPHRAAFVGHHHCWFATTPTGPVSWDGSAPLQLAATERYLIVVAPIFQGSFAVVDTDRGDVTPHTLPDR
ncbi:MAG: metallophosphoesterase family protein [Gemmataceae bacterium]